MCLTSYCGVVCCAHRAWGGQLPLPVPAVPSIASQMENGPHASLVPSVLPSLRRCQESGATSSTVSVQEKRGWSHTGSVAWTEPSKGMGSAWV